MKNILFIISIIFISACSRISSDELFAIDQEFSNYSKLHGINKAFIAYAHDSAVILRAHTMPIIGKTAIEKLYQINDSGLELTWEPQYAKVSKAADIGYTYGIYTLKSGETESKGTYVTIWQNTDEGWKYVLDTGNEGLE